MWFRWPNYLAASEGMSAFLFSFSGSCVIYVSTSHADHGTLASSPMHCAWVWDVCLQLEIDPRPEAFADVEKVVPKLMAAIDDAHFKVSPLTP